MKTALFILLPYPSHYFVGFGKAHQLKAKGYEVVFTGLNSHRTLIEREGFNYTFLHYASEYKTLNLKTWMALLIQSLFNKSYTWKRYRIFWEEVKAVQKTVLTTNPDLIFLDSHLGHYALSLANNHSQKIILNTKLSSFPSTGIPPLTEGWLASQSFVSKMHAWWNWQCHIAKRRRKKWLEKTAFLGKDDIWLQSRLAKRVRLVQANYFDEKHCFFPAVKGLQKLIVYPKSLDYPWVAPQSDEYYEAIPFERNESHLMTHEYVQFMEKLALIKYNAPATKVIYANLGTTGLNDTQEGRLGLHKIVEAIQLLPNVQMVVSSVLFESSNYQNVHVFAEVPQLDLLKHCDLMISHGGLNSICECLQAGVPMLLCPLSHKADHFGNAARVVYHKLGLSTTINQDDIIKKIRELLLMDE